MRSSLLCAFLGLALTACTAGAPLLNRAAHSDAIDARALALPEQTDPRITQGDLAYHVGALTDERTQGRRAGTPGERVAADYLARAFASVELEPAGDDGEFTHRFDFTSGVALGPTNTLTLRADDGAVAKEFAVDRDWRPMAFSRSGPIEASPVVFAGYGLVAPEHAGSPAVNDYQWTAGAPRAEGAPLTPGAPSATDARLATASRETAPDLDVRDKWVLLFRGLPEGVDGERRQLLQRHASLRYKAMVARDRGARGVLFVSGPRAQYRNEVVPLRFDASLAGTRIGVLSLSNASAESLLAGAGLTLEDLQAGADARIEEEASPQNHSDPTAAFSKIRISGQIDLETLRAEGQSVLGRLQVGDTPSAQTIVVGAHFDHLGHGQGSGSLAAGDEVGSIHPGADDNASGTAVLIEVAEALAHRRRAGQAIGVRDFIFAAWSGEELGLLGSDAWASQNINPHTQESGPVAYLNFDMVGRLGKSLIVQGLGSSPDWEPLLEEAGRSSALSIATQQDSYVPSDATSFYTQGIPILNAFTGVHSEYHTPRDTPERLNLAGSAQIGELFTQIAVAVSSRTEPPEYRAQKAPSGGQSRSGFRVFLGTIPDYAQSDVTGVRLSGVAPAGPADSAGLRRGDIIVEVDGRPIENLYDYTYALDALRVGVPARVHVLRGTERIETRVVPASRD